jgi:coenzyme PQQ precursor peptide PqqA
MTTTWTKPSFTEICMNAEIGAYQADDGGEQLGNPVLAAPTGQDRPAPIELHPKASDADAHIP